jgi:hypothetical protein
MAICYRPDDEQLAPSRGTDTGEVMPSAVIQ